jgi:hypothetical protein
MKEFHITTGSLVISDPTSPIPHWGNATVKGKPGKWTSSLQRDRVYNKISALIATHIDAPKENPRIVDDLWGLQKNNAPIPFLFNVDSGQLGYFDLANFPTKDGVTVQSGWGNGSYKTYGIKDPDGAYIALLTVFIENADTDFDDDSGNDDEDADEEFDDD